MKDFEKTEEHSRVIDLTSFLFLMAMPADSSASNNSPLTPVTTADGGSGTSSAAVKSPNSRRRLKSPWAQVVRGGGDAEPTTVTAPHSPSSSTRRSFSSILLG
ncbi:hypothetical protein HAX54_009885 [Datura stramonium]|uniref:Uncharacterized protein n=1 Tax=Datura stramonium TaxID=4076 RepID=A0ABS8TGD6_DATST|nr:hypothetical protein [Datura stramonium]